MLLADDRSVVRFCADLISYRLLKTALILTRPTPPGRDASSPRQGGRERDHRTIRPETM